MPETARRYPLTNRARTTMQFRGKLLDGYLVSGRELRPIHYLVADEKTSRVAGKAIPGRSRGEREKLESTETESVEVAAHAPQPHSKPCVSDAVILAGFCIASHRISASIVPCQQFSKNSHHPLLQFLARLASPDAMRCAMRCAAWRFPY